MGGEFRSGRLARDYPELLGKDFASDQEVSFVGFGPEHQRYQEELAVRAGEVATWLWRDAWDHASNNGNTIAVFSHHTFLNCLLRILLEGSPGALHDPSKYRFENTGITELLAGLDGRLHVV